MEARTKYLLFGLVGAIAVVAIVQGPNGGPKADPAAAARGALALTAAKTIKSAANDPRAIEFILMDVSADALAACAEYRGKNRFNATVKQFTVFVNGVGVTDDVEVWNKHCTKNMHSLLPLVK